MTVVSLPDLLVDTPAVVIDRPRFGRNIERVQAIADDHAVALWPHVKTHKCGRLAALQMVAGARGLTVAKADEALRFLEAGFKDLLIAYPWLGRRKLERLLATSEQVDARLTFTADSSAGVALLQEIAGDRGRSLDVMLKVDVGLHRCGVDPAGPELVDVARTIADGPRLAFAGLLSHAGHAYAAANAAAVAMLACREREVMVSAVDRLMRAGIEPTLVSVGATPTVLAHAGFEGIDQIRPGNYVFNDLTQVRLGVVGIDDVALTVFATVVSRGAGWAVIDAGSKCLSSDTAPHGVQASVGYGLAFRLEDPLEIGHALRIARLSEEHAVVEDEARRLAVGEQVRVFPNHACPVVNLTDRLLVVEGSEVLDVWPVMARSCSR